MEPGVCAEAANLNRLMRICAAGLSTVYPNGTVQPLLPQLLLRQFAFQPQAFFLPFLKQGLIETDGIIIDAKTGTSGGGRIPKEAMLLAEASESIAPYGVVGHRHTSEIEQMSSEVAGQAVQLQFTPHLVPMVRGLLSTVYARLRDPGLTADDCTTVLEAVYRHHPCVCVLPVGTYPATKWARTTNRALLSVQVDSRTGQLVLMSAIDNLIKGQAGQGVQSLKLKAGLAVETVLPLQAFYP